MAMANPQPPPHTSVQEQPTEAGIRTTTGDKSGVRCGNAPGKYPHMKTNRSLFTSSIFTSSLSFPSPFISNREGKRKENQNNNKKNKKTIGVLFFYLFLFNLFASLVRGALILGRIKSGAYHFQGNGMCHVGCSRGRKFTWPNISR